MDELFMEYTILNRGNDEFGNDVQLIKDNEGAYVVFHEKYMNVHEFGSHYDDALNHFNELIYKG